MVTDGAPSGPPQLGPLASRPVPPITAVSIACMCCALAGGIDVAAYLPRHPSLAAPSGFLAAAALLLLANVGLLTRVGEFAWHVFWRVVGWALLSYVVIAGMILYVMIYDGTRGSLLGVMAGIIVVFAVNIPLLLGFSVARYQEPHPETA